MLIVMNITLLGQSMADDTVLTIDGQAFFKALGWDSGGIAGLLTLHAVSPFGYAPDHNLRFDSAHRVSATQTTLGGC
jgi:hypothetical protein